MVDLSKISQLATDATEAPVSGAGSNESTFASKSTSSDGSLPIQTSTVFSFMSQNGTSVMQPACGLSSQDVVNDISTPPPELVNTRPSPSHVAQPIESVDAATTEINNAGADPRSMSLNQAVLDVLPNVVDSGPCVTSELVNAIEEDVLQIEQPTVVVPSTSISTIPTTNTHHMTTRSKVGTFKPKLYALEWRRRNQRKY
ncbi:hypothetical protein V6N11_051705 [Hibiscus sabdariffa]|uniref:Uncharacterized protein n=1 Tax=Hibiscus sabdariffa TaxID=183260 RepID=A0ABR2U839_9ROSI